MCREAELESQFINLLTTIGWTYREDLKNENSLWENLRRIINTNNKAALQGLPLTDREWEDLKGSILAHTKTPFEACKWLKGVGGLVTLTIEREDQGRGPVSLVVYGSRATETYTPVYEVVHQIRTHAALQRSSRFDVTLLISGFPMVNIELKSDHAKDGFMAAFYQIQRYIKEGCFQNNIFNSLHLFVISNESDTRYFANCEHRQLTPRTLTVWRKADNERVGELMEFTREFLSSGFVQQMVRDYMVLSEDGSKKMVMALRPYQIHAITRIYAAVESNQPGYIWHATGSGKTMTSFVATKLLSRRPKIDRTIMVVDRRDLDQQTCMEFTKFAPEYDTGSNLVKNSLVVGTGSTNELVDALFKESNSNSIIITTIQKLATAIDVAKGESRKRKVSEYQEKLAAFMNSHVVFIVDECHRAVSGIEQDEIKKFFPNSIWIGFTGTPIFEENKKAEMGLRPRTTEDQYGRCLHRYTIGDALNDGATLAFQVEHETTIRKESLDTMCVAKFMADGYSAEEAQEPLNGMTLLAKEATLKTEAFEKDEHIESVVKKILNPNSAFVRFGFQNGRPTMSAILTTSSIAMAQRYYDVFKNKGKALMEEAMKESPLILGRRIADDDFPRVAVTYSLAENTVDSVKNTEKMEEILADYNAYYGTNWGIESINQYNAEVNRRLAKKSAIYQEFGKQLDLVIVVDRLLTGFDAPTIQTLFVDRNLQYAGLIQAFSRTNRTYVAPDGRTKEKGFIVTYRMPATMEQHVKEAVKLYCVGSEDKEVIYPTYEEMKAKLKRALREFQELEASGTLQNLSGHSPDKLQEVFLRHYHRLDRLSRGISTYEEYALEFNGELLERRAVHEVEGVRMSKEEVLQEAETYYSGLKVGESDEAYLTSVGMMSTVQATLDKWAGQKNNISAYRRKKKPPTKTFDNICFYTGYEAQPYNVDVEYIDELLKLYPTNRNKFKDEIMAALDRSKTAPYIKDLYAALLEDISAKDLHGEDIIDERDRVFKDTNTEVITDFSRNWCVSAEELGTSLFEYVCGESENPNIRAILDTCDYVKLRSLHPDFIGMAPFRINGAIKTAWLDTLRDKLGPINDALQ